GLSEEKRAQAALPNNREAAQRKAPATARERPPAAESPDRAKKPIFSGTGFSLCFPSRSRELARAGNIYRVFYAYEPPKLFEADRHRRRGIGSAQPLRRCAERSPNCRSPGSDPLP